MNYILSQRTDLKGRALNEWKAQVESANSSLVQDDITNSILRAPSLHCYQMRDIVEMIVDLIVFRVLIFDQLKNKALIKQDLYKLKLESNFFGERSMNYIADFERKLTDSIQKGSSLIAR